MRRLFGTDGVRGIANEDLSVELAMKLGKALGTVLSEGQRYRPEVFIGQDTRLSSEMLVSAISSGLCSAGCDTVLLGVVTTPCVAYLVKEKRARAGVMISASHNSFDFNGIKIFGEDGFKLSDELEELIESIVLDNSPPPRIATPREIGKCTVNHSYSKEYAEYLKASFGQPLDGLTVGIDCANGSASVTAGALFTSLGAEVHLLHREPNGININTNCGSTHIESLAAYVTANKVDCGLAFDGDADRLLCVDEAGALVDGDRIMAICALDLKERGKLTHQTAVGTVMTNLGFSRFCEENGIRFIATKVGDRYVLEEMLLGEYAIGGEQSGHIIFREFATTGDGQLTALALLSIMKRKGLPLSQLAAVMRKYPQTMVNITATADGKLHFYTDPEIRRALDRAAVELGSGGRIVVRPSGTEPLIRIMAEGEELSVIQRITDGVASVIRDRLATYE